MSAFILQFLKFRKKFASFGVNHQKICVRKNSRTILNCDNITMYVLFQLFLDNMWSSISNFFWPITRFHDRLDDEELLRDLDLLVDESAEENVLSSGVVTEFQADYGLIDNDLYFPRSLLPKICERPLQVGDRVQYKATRKGLNLQWKVTELLASYGKDHDWEGPNVEESGDKTKSKDVGKIVDLSNHRRAVHVEIQGENTREVLQFDAKLLDFLPKIGDLLSVELLLQGDSLDDVQGAKVVGASALRTLTLQDAAVTSWWQNLCKGVIDNSVYFSTDSCTPSYSPRSRDIVRAHAIECEPSDATRRCSWRATRVIPKGSGINRPKPLSSAHLENPSQASFLEELLQDKHGIHIDETIDLGAVPRNQTIKQTISVMSHGESDVLLTDVCFLGESRRSPMAICDKTVKLPFVIPSKSNTLLSIECNAKDLGCTKILAVFSFKSKEVEFQIGAHFLLDVRDPILDQLQSSVRPVDYRFNYCDGQLSQGRQHIIPGQRKKSDRGPVFAKRKLADYPIPCRLQSAMTEGDPSELLDQFPYLGEGLCVANYKEKFSNLLHLEEIEQNEQMTRYTLISVPFQIQGPYLSLEVPGLSEKRPSLAIGDTAIARLSRVTSAQLYEGYIHEVRSKSVLLMFNEHFHSMYTGEVYDVEFRFSRGQFKRMHQAIDEVVKNFGEQVLFPKEVNALPSQVDFVLEQENPRLAYDSFPCEKKLRRFPKCKLKKRRTSVVESLFAAKIDYGKEWVTPVLPLKRHSESKAPFKLEELPYSLEYEFKLTDQEGTSKNRTKEKPPYIPKEMLTRKIDVSASGHLILRWVNQDLNPEQKNAVTRILSGHARPLPYIIYGPPGTGKTVTVVETILQIFALRQDARILVVTPSNSAADLIVERLHKSGQIQYGDLARLNAFQRPLDVIPDVVKPYSFQNDDLGMLAKVVLHRIVVATCSTSGGLYKLGLREGHFTHCFVDEAGETTEPETMIPIGLLATSDKSQIILAGDPKQLGPVLHSPEAKLYGLEMSFLERLSLLPLYERDASRFKDHGNYDPMLVTKLVRNYRSHEDIIRVPSELFYEDELLPFADEKIAKAFQNSKVLIHPEHPVIFHGVRGQNYQEGDSPSWFNPTEAVQVAYYFQSLLNNLVDPDDVGIIAPYRQQTAKLKQILRSMNLPVPRVCDLFASQ